MAGYIILGRYKGNKEVIDSAEDKQQAEYLKSKYQMAFGADWSITIKKATQSEWKEVN